MNNVAIAKAYYQSMDEKNLLGIEPYIDAQIDFITSMATIKGKEQFMEAVKSFQTQIHSIIVQTAYESHNKVLVIYNVDLFNEPGALLHGASLMTFQNRLITKIEIFWDNQKLN